MLTAVETFTFEVAAHGHTTARTYRAAQPMNATLVLAHGAGASQSHPFMTHVATSLAARGIDVVTFDFLYMDRGKKIPDRADVLEATWIGAIASVRARLGPGSRLFCGGKSMGGRMISNVAATAGDTLHLAGLVFLGYPLHPSGKPNVRRDAHLGNVPFPMLFVQGARDPFGDEREMAALVRTLPGARLHVVPFADHSFSVPKKFGPDAEQAGRDALADAIVAFVRGTAE